MASRTRAQVAFTAYGHPNVRATHWSTMEVTTQPNLTLKGDCILGVRADKSPNMIDAAIGWLLRRETSRITTRLSAGEFAEEIHGVGSPRLSLRNASSLVWRTSNYVDDRTVAIRCDKAARDVARELVSQLQNSEAVLQVVILVSAGTT
jgi:hypothetical protein